jgi:hypothetical protein
MVINIFLAILIIIRMLTGLRLFLSGRKNNLPNLIWLSVSMFVTVIILLLVPLESNPLAHLPFSLWIFTLGSIAGQASLIIFNQLTFYKDRKSPVGWIWAIFIIFSAIAMYGVMVSESNFKQSVWVAASLPVGVVIWGWHGLLAYQALSQIALEKNVEDWVKARYRLIVTYAIVLIIGTIASIIRNFFASGAESPLGSLMSIISLITQIVSIALLFLVWAMPESFRRWLNRNYQKRRDEQVYEQAFSIMDILGTSMSTGTNLPKSLALVAIRKTIGREINTEDSKKIEAHVVGLGYEDWSQFLNTPELRVFIKEIANANPNDVLANAKHTLIENQSLFTIQAK